MDVMEGFEVLMDDSSDKLNQLTKVAPEIEFTDERYRKMIKRERKLQRKAKSEKIARSVNRDIHIEINTSKP